MRNGLLVLGTFSVIALSLLIGDSSASIDADIYLDFESGNNGDSVTTSYLSSVTHGDGGSWIYREGSAWMTVSTSEIMQITEPVNVGGTLYDDSSGTRSIMYDDSQSRSNLHQYLWSGGKSDDVTVGVFMRLPTASSGYYGDVLKIKQESGGYCSCVAQIRGASGNSWIQAHTYNDNTGTRYSGGNSYSGNIKYVANKWYWFNLRFSKTDGQCCLSAWDPDDWSQIDSTVCVGITNSFSADRFAIGNDPHDVSISGSHYYDNLIVDRSGTFPLGIPTQQSCSLDSECDDGLYCNGAETCSGGSCQSGTPPCSADGYSCTMDCDEATDTCYVTDDSLCDDGIACTVDTCVGSVGDANGCSFAPGTCTVPQGCTSATCDVNQGCVYSPSGCGSSDLVLELKLDEGSGTSTQDTSTYGNDGTVSGATWTTGISGSALSFDGDNDYLSATTDGMSAGAGTISLWVNPGGFPGDNLILGHTTTPAYANRIQLYTDDTAGNLDLGLGDSHTTATNIFDLEPGTWYHVALTWDGSDYAVYVNGNQEASGTYTGLSSINSFVDIGNNGNSVSRTEAFDGTIDEIKVYSRVLTGSEISQLYSEYSLPASACASKADTSGNDAVEITELISYIAQWKAGSVTMNSLMAAIGEWVDGC